MTTVKWLLQGSPVRRIGARLPEKKSLWNCKREAASLLGWPLLPIDQIAPELLAIAIRGTVTVQQHAQSVVITDDDRMFVCCQRTEP